MHREAVAAVLRSTPHKWRTSAKLISEAMVVHVVYRAKPLWTYHCDGCDRYDSKTDVL